jgi:GrpB-like predicted nucleotidyltransferase (UPF0157 family)
MLTKKQQEWVGRLSDKPGEIKIIPFDPTSQEKFEKIRSTIQSELGESMPVEHHGASSLGISGQDEIDVYIPVSPAQYDSTVKMAVELFGEPRSHYPLERTRFRTSQDGKRIDLFVINQESLEWLNGLKFEKYLRANPEVLNDYRKLKEAGDGLSSQEYYRRKIEFINNILSRIK